MKKLIFGVFFFLLLSITESVHATHIIGGEITYKCLGGQTYQFNLAIYTECGSPIILEDTYYLKYFSESLNIPLNSSLSFEVLKVNEEEISFYCASVETNCGAGGYRGIKRLDYSGIIDLSEHGRAKDWVFFWQKSARSELINTLLSPEDEDYYAEVVMNNVDAFCNNSPTFSSNPAVTACIYLPQVFSNTATDVNGDQLRFRLAPPRSSYNEEVIYTEGYDHENFVKHSGTISLDSSTGDLSFVTTSEEIGVTDIVVEERRNGILISRITRGIQVTSMDCANENPVISDLIDLDTTVVSVCAGETIDVKFSASDPDGQNLIMNIQSGNLTQFFVANNGTPNPVGNLIWQTSRQDAGIHLFTIRVDDGVCPEPGLATKTFIMNVHSLPEFDLGDDIHTSCNNPVEVSPSVADGDGNYTYLWTNDQDSKSADLGPGKHFLTVTDGNGCTSRDSITILASVIPDFHTTKRCFGFPVEFADSTKTTGSKIISWKWDFGDGGRSTLQHPKHSYGSPGVYLVSLELSDDANPACVIEVKKPVAVCGDIEFGFVPQDTCSGLSMEFIVNSTADDACDIDSLYFDYGDGSSGNLTSHIYETGGEYLVKLAVTTRAGCQQEFSRTITVLQSPDVEIDNGESSYLDCTHPDVHLTTKTLPGDGSTLNFLWNTGDTSPDLIIRETGTFTVTAFDENNCFDIDTYRLLFPLDVNFQFNAFCELGDSLQFSEDVFHEFAITSWEWNFGDGSTSTDPTPQPHLYANLGDYETKLKVTDENNCKDSLSLPVYNTRPDFDEFDVTPNDVTICVKDTVFGFGPSGEHIDLYTWNFDNGRLSHLKDPFLFYSSTGVYDVSLQVDYNQLTGVNEGCTKAFGETVEVHPELNAEIQLSRICKDIEVEFGFERNVGDLDIPIVRAHWDFGDGTGFSDDMQPSYTYDSTGLYNLVLNVEDELGCLRKITKVVKVERVATPDFTYNEACENEPMSFHSAFRDSLENITHYRWIFDDKDTIENIWPIPRLTLHTLNKGTSHTAQLTVWNEFSHCDRSVTKTITPLELPKVDFEIDTLCANEVAYFINTSTGSSPITGFQWLFHDGSTSDDFEPSKKYAVPGIYEVSLVGFNELNCTDTLTKNVVVLEIPDADFRTGDDFVEAFVPVQFINQSSGDVTDFYWNFGDGSTSSEEHPVHTYDTIKVYFVELIVMDFNGCTDSIQSRTDLNVHLDLPTAFSPNNDDKNDELGLIHHGIKELYEYKVFNRWGQLVFDGHNDLNAVWDGTLNGARQDAGVYVAHVKALGAYDIQFNFKKNVTLLR